MANVAIPFTAVARVVPKRLAPPGLSAMANVTASVAVVTVFPTASWMATWMAGAFGAPTMAVDGWTRNASLFPLPTSIAKGSVVTLVRPVLDAVSV